MAARTRRASVAALVVSLAVAACSRSDETTPATLEPLVTAVSVPDTTVAPSTTLGVIAPSEPLVPALPDAACAFDPPTGASEISFLAGDRLYVVSPDASIVRCVAAIAPEARGRVQWGPRGDRVLVGAATIVDAFGARASGFDAQNTRVQWEFPSGEALFAPTANSATLVRRSAFDTNDRTEITFLRRTDVAVSHPGGGAVLAGGLARDGTRGLFVSDPTGVRMITQLEEGQSVAEIAPDGSGTSVYFVRAHDDGSRAAVHRLALPDLALAELASESAPIAQLTAGPVEGVLAWRVGLCNALTELRVQDARDGSIRAVGVGTALQGLSLAPAGWLDGVRLLVASRPLGCDGPADVWIWNLLDGSATLIVRNVEFPTVRIVYPAAAPLQINPTAQPPLA